MSMTGCYSITTQFSDGSADGVYLSGARGRVARHFTAEVRDIYLVYGLLPIVTPQRDVLGRYSRQGKIANLRIEYQDDAIDVLVGLVTDGLVGARTIRYEGDILRKGGSR